MGPVPGLFTQVFSKVNVFPELIGAMVTTEA